MKKKRVLRIVLGFVIALVLAVGAAWLMIDSIAKKGIQQGGQIAMGVPTDVEDVQLSLLNGTMMIDKLTVSNPEGFNSPHLMQTGRFDLEVRPGSVINSPIDVQKFILDGLDVYIERTAKGNNISVVMNNVKKLGSPADSSKKDAPKEESKGRKIRVGKLVIKNVVAHVMLPLGPESKDLTIKIPSIELDDVTKDSPDGVPISELVGRILPAVLASVIQQGKGIIPTDLAGILNSDVASAANAIGSQASKLVQQVGGDAAALVTQGADKAVKDVQKNVEKGTGDIKKGIGDALKGVLPGAKSQPGE